MGLFRNVNWVEVVGSGENGERARATSSRPAAPLALPAPGSRRVATFEWRSGCDECAQFPIPIYERTLRIERSGGSHFQFRGDFVRIGDGDLLRTSAFQLMGGGIGKGSLEPMR